MAPTLRQLRSFVLAARSGSLGRAAEALHLSQPALTVQLRDLERDLGLRLLDRGPRGTAPTPAGQALAASLTRILSDLDTVMAEARDAAARRVGVVRVAALPSMGATLLPAVAARLRAAHPGLRLVIHDVVAGRIGALLRDGVDMGIGTAMGAEPGLETAALLRDRLVAVIPPGHRLATAADRPIGLAELAGEALVLVEAGTSVRTLFDRACAKLGLQVLPACEATAMSTVVGLVQAGLGVGVLPSSAVDLRSAPALAVRAITQPAITRTVVLIRPAGRTPSPAAAAFLDALRAELGVGSPVVAGAAPGAAEACRPAGSVLHRARVGRA